jgi:acetyl-CoA/propionyl-CoA carboxylase biotin carboxyl carrier protein
VTTFVAPAGPGVRVDSGVQSGDVISGAFDSLLAKVIVTGASRQQALERSRRALDEMVVEGMATALPFHRAVVRDEAFAPADPDKHFTVHNRWIETEFDNTIPPFTGGGAVEDETAPRERVTVEVGGKRLEVVLPQGLAAANGSGVAGTKAAPKRGGAGRKKVAAASGDSVTSPMQGTIVKVVVEEGAEVEIGDSIVVLEAMKMEQPITAHKAGTVSGLAAAVGEVVASGAVLCEIKG